jgi:integrase
MPRPRPPYLSHERTRHGKPVWYVRRHGKRVRIKAAFGTPDFDREYQAAIAGTSSTRATVTLAAAHGSLGWLIERYREAQPWRDLSPATRAMRNRIFRQVIERAGHAPLGQIAKSSIINSRDARAATPFQARHYLDTMRGLFRWAVDALMVRVDPTEGVKNLTRKSGPGFVTWTEDDVARYEERWPIGTRQRVWLDVLLYTGLRRGDAVRLGRQHVKAGVATILTEKSGTVVTLPILPVLAQTIAAGPCGDLTFVATAKGGPFTSDSFGWSFRQACRAAGVPGSAHGLRKAAATRAANAGATVAQLEAIFGWSGGGMASLYTRAADRRRLAIEAMGKLDGKRAAIVAP